MFLIEVFYFTYHPLLDGPPRLDINPRVNFVLKQYQHLTYVYKESIAENAIYHISTQINANEGKKKKKTQLSLFFLRKSPRFHKISPFQFLKRHRNGLKMPLWSTFCVEKIEFAFKHNFFLCK